MIAKVFAAKFSDKTSKDLLEKADIKENGDYLKNPKNIEILVNKLMKIGEVEYIHEFKTTATD